MKIRINGMYYEVSEDDTLPKNLNGQIRYNEKKIRLRRTKLDGTQRTDVDVNDTLWHEIVHGILHEMGSRKAYDELFVTSLAACIVSIQQQLYEYADGAA